MVPRNKFSFLQERDNRVKIMNDRINLTEKYFMELCSEFAAFNRKLGRYRDKHDELAKVLKSYSDDEIINKSLIFGLDSFSKAITLLSDYLDLEVQRIDIKVVNELKQYEQVCRSSRENLKMAVSKRDKEAMRERQYIDLKTKFGPTAADSELLKVKLEVDKTNKDIDNIIENFEKQKLKTVKNLLLDFIHIHMKQHTKAIEILSATCQDILNIDEKRDFQAFKKSIKTKQKTDNLNKFRSQSIDNLQEHPLSGKNEQYSLSKSVKDLSKLKDFENTNDSSEDESESDSASNSNDNSLSSTEQEDETEEEDNNQEEQKKNNETDIQHQPSSSGIRKVRGINGNLEETISKNITLTPSTSVNNGRLVTVKSINSTSK